MNPYQKMVIFALRIVVLYCVGVMLGALVVPLVTS